MGCNASKALVHTEPINLKSVKARVGSRRIQNPAASSAAGMRRYGSSGRGKWTATESTEHPDTKDPGVQRVMKICGF